MWSMVVCKSILIPKNLTAVKREFLVGSHRHETDVATTSNSSLKCFHIFNSRLQFNIEVHTEEML